MDSKVVLAPEAKAPEVPARREIDKFNIPFVCARSGLLLGKFFPTSSMAGSTPYVQHWKETIQYHPIFSLSFSALLHRANACWQLEKAGSRQFPMLQKQLLFLALLHSSGLIKQDVAGLPSPKIVEIHFSRVLELLGYKNDTNSSRLHLPKLHIWKGAAKEDGTNLFGNIPAWLDACESCKDDYENVARERQKAAKSKAHELALKSIRRAMYSDISLKRLWGWVEAQVPATEFELDETFKQLFFCEENQINVWTEDDIEDLESLILKFCETGNSVSFEVLKRVKQLREWLYIYNDTFEIVTTNVQFAALAGTPEPKISEFKTKAEWLVASARWKLGNQSAQELGKDEL